MSDERWGYGNPKDVTAFDHQRMDDGSPFEIVRGEHPHARQDNQMYARFPDGRIEDFDGHRIRTHVELRTFNYLKCSGLSGNEVRKGGQYRIYLNDRIVWGKFIREADYGLLAAHHTLSRLLDCPMSLWRPDEPEIGRRVFYRDHPAIIESFSCDQNEGAGNRLILRSAEGVFPRPCWCEDEDYDASETIVTNTLDESIWWWRK